MTRLNDSALKLIEKVLQKKLGSLVSTYNRYAHKATDCFKVECIKNMEELQQILEVIKQMIEESKTEVKDESTKR